MLFLLLVLLSPFAFAEESPEDQRADCQVALVEETSGTVKLQAGEDGAPVALAADDAVQPGDIVLTERASWADLRLCDGSGIRVGEASRFEYVGAGNEREHFASWAFELVRGVIRAAVIGDGQGGQVKLRVRTPTAALGVRGTELVIDASDDGEQETQLHTIEGEVLMGPRADFERLAELRGGELRESFEPVGKERMSLIRKSEARPLRAAAFKLWEFRRGALLDRPLRKLGWGEVRPRLRKARLRMRQRRPEKPLFERPRAKIEERLEKKELVEQRKEQRREEKKREEIQEKREAQRNRSTDARQQALRKELQQNQADTQDKRTHKGWRKWYQKNPNSPRHPNLGN